MRPLSPRAAVRTIRPDGRSPPVEVRSAHADERSDGGAAAVSACRPRSWQRYSSCRPTSRRETTLVVRLDRIAAQMKMRRAITRTRAARMTAEGDGLALFVAAIRIAAIAALQLDQGKMPRFDPDAAQLDRLDLFEHRRRPRKRRRPEITGTEARAISCRLGRLGRHRRLSGDRPAASPRRRARPSAALRE